jgi:hypothetical protein
VSKNKKKNKNMRRFLEAQIAHGVVASRDAAMVRVGAHVSSQVIESGKNGIIKSDVILPITVIKRDLIKNVIFMITSVAILVVLKLTNFGYAQISKFVTF